MNMSLGSSPDQGHGLVFGGNRPKQGHGLKHGPQWQNRPGPHQNPRWHHQLLPSGCKPVPHYLQGLQLCLSSLCPYPSVSVSIPFLYHSLFLVVPRLCIMSSRGHFGHGLPPEACMVPDWWSSQALLFPGNVRLLIIGMFTGQNIAALLSATY